MANIKNVPIAIAAGAAIGTADLEWPLVIVASAVFALLSCLGLIVLSVVGASHSSAVSSGLASAKAALIRHNSLIMMVLFVILGALQLGRALEAL